jgi:hypothetical protein
MWEKPSPSLFTSDPFSKRPLVRRTNSAVLVEHCAFLVCRAKNRTLGSTRGLTDARKQLMFSRVTVSLAVIAAMLVATERSATASCILVNSPSQKACAVPCCANKVCCETSKNRAGEPTQPLSTANSLQNNVIALAATVPTGKIVLPRAVEIYTSFESEQSWHSPETLALLCIRLI